MKKSFAGGFSALLLMLLLNGCNPFTTNIYSGIDKYKMPDLDDVDEVLDAANDPDFYENLKDDPKAKEKVLETLEDTYNDPDEDEETRQVAALMAADVHLKTSDTEDTLDNFNDLISDAANGEEIYDSDSGDGPEVLFKSLFGDPPYPVGTSTTSSSYISYKKLVTTQLNGFLLAIPALQAYGNNVNAGFPIPPDANAGDTATKALMAGLTRYISFMLDVDGDNSSVSDAGYVSGIESADVDRLAVYLANPDSDANLEGQYRRELTVPDDVDEIEYFLTDPVSGDKGIYYAVNAGLDINSLMD